MAGLLGKNLWSSVPLAVLIGVPIYSNVAGVMPIVEALLGKGAALGSTLAFMMAVIGLSLPETIILSKVMRPRLIATFVGGSPLRGSGTVLSRVISVGGRAYVLSTFTHDGTSADLQDRLVAGFRTDAAR